MISKIVSKRSKTILIIFAIILNACSTFNGMNPFSKPEVVDYNALTYGDHYQESREWKSTATKTFRDGSELQANERAQASKANSYYAKQDEEQGLDASDENVRRRVAVDRGQAVIAYKGGDRATRNDFYDTTLNDGSLWSNEQDSNYFFTKDKVRTVGDIVSVKLDETMIKTIAEEVKKNLTPAEQEVEMAIYLKNNDLAKNDKDIQAYRNVAAEELKSNEAAQVKDKMEKAVRWSQIDLSKALGVAPAEEIRAEIIDRYPNGNYKIRAIKRILYRGSSKQISLMGVAPIADFDDKDQIASAKLYETRVKVAR